MRIMAGTVWTVVALVLCCVWGLGALQLALRSHPTGFGPDLLVELLWAALSLFVFVLATGGIAVLIAFGVDRGRPAIWITVAIAAVLFVLVTWGYVAATRAAMIRYDTTGPVEYPQPSGR